MSASPESSIPDGSKLALTVLVVLVILSPWPFGSAHLRSTQAIALVSLATAFAAFLWDGWHRQLQLPPRAILWPLIGLWALAVFQLIPLPEGSHRWIAPGSAAVWHPDVPAAAAVLGPGPHPISLYPEATRRWLSFAAGVIALGLAAAPALHDRRLLLRASTAVVGGAVLVALYAFVARLAFGNKIYGVWSVPTVAPFGPFVSKNHFAGYVELAAILTIGLATGLTDEARHGLGWLSWIESRRAKWVVAAWGAALVLVLAVPVSLSRGGVISLCAGLLMFGGLRLWTRGPSRLLTRSLAVSLVGALLVTAVIGAALPAEARSRILSLTGITSDQSGSYRIGIWRDTLGLIASSPAVGSGFGAYADALPRFKTTAGQLGIEHAENDHLEFLAEGGVFGMLLGAVALVVLVLLTSKAVRSEERRLLRAAQAASLAGLAAVYVHCAFDFNLRIPSNVLMAAFVAALATATVQQVLQRNEGRSGSMLGGLVVAATLLVAVSTHWAGPRWDASALARAAAPSRPDLRRWTLALEVSQLLRQRPAYATGWVQLAWLRQLASSEEASALVRWGLTLDPLHKELARASTRVLLRSR